MSALTWSDALELQQPQMDHSHREFVELLDQVRQMLDGPQQALTECLDDFVLHTERHFDQEERWMATLGFTTVNCHSHQHAQVLQVVREVQRRLLEQSDRDIVRLLVGELAQWFPMHAQQMDAALAQTMSERGYDPETGQLRHPLPAADEGEAPHTGGGCDNGCGGNHCGNGNGCGGSGGSSGSGSGCR